MKNTEFISAGQTIFGRYGWKGQMAEELGVSRTTITRYCSSTSSIPKATTLAV